MSAQIESREYRELQAEYRSLQALNAELLEALEAIVNLSPAATIGKVKNIAEAAIAKAR